MIDYLQPTRVRWDQRGMAALAVVYVIVLYAMIDGHLDEDSVGTTCIFFGIILATPQLAQRNKAFSVVCGILAILLLVSGVFLFSLGYWIFVPAFLPLALAPIRIPERWTPVATPVILAIVTAVLAVAAYVFSTPARTW